MYKSHITAWGIRKNNRVLEARAILHRKHVLDSQGYSSIFIVRGRLADLADVERCCKRAKEQSSDHGSDEPEHLPEGIDVVILPNQMASIAAPERFRTLQSFLHHTAVYIDSCFDQGTWQSFSDDDDLTSYSQVDENLAKLCFDKLGFASACFSTGLIHLGTAYARQAVFQFRPLLQCNHQDVMPNLLIQLQRIQERGFKEMLEFVLRSLSEIAMLTLPPSHPHERVLTALKDLGVESLESVYEVYLTQVRSLYARKLGTTHFRVVRTDFLLSQGKDLTSTPWTEIQEAIADADNQYGAGSRRAFQVLRSYCYRLYKAGRWREATVLFGLALSANESSHYHTRLSALFRLGTNLDPRGNSDRANGYWLELLRLAEQDVEVFKYLGPEVLDDLEARIKEDKQYHPQLSAYQRAHSGAADAPCHSDFKRASPHEHLDDWTAVSTYTT